MLTAKELKQLSSLLKKIDNPHEGLPQPVFDALLGIVPFVACELAVVNKKGELLLTWRSDKWWRGWHFPGGLMRFRETFEERIDAVAWKELGVNLESAKFLFAKDCSQASRGHVVSLTFLCKTFMTPKQGKFFKKMPKNIIENHKELWEKIQKYLK
ncbi:MAG: NUDIX domain-containing protein [Patescibacteria group bacterium]